MTTLAAPAETEPYADLTADEVREWPGVWSVRRTFAGWVMYADPRFPEDAVSSARKLSDSTGRTVVVEGLVIHP